MIRFLRFSLAPVAIFSLTAACTQQPGSDKTGRAAAPQVIRGDAISAVDSGIVQVQSNGLFCSGILLRNDWVITAQHCSVDVTTPANTTVMMGMQNTVGAFAVAHPSLDFALIRLLNPIQMNGSTTGFRRALYANSSTSLEGTMVTCKGYGCNAYTPGDPNIENCTGIDGTLREAVLPVKPGGTDDYNFTVTKNSKGQVLAPGDSGTGCFVSKAGDLELAGVNHAGSMEENYLGKPENWRDWAKAYMDGTPIPLPDHWFVYTSSHPEFLTRPLPQNYTEQHSWNPCPGGATYSFAPTFDLENGGDFITIKSGATTVSLTGKGSTVCTGSGPITAGVKTNGTVQSIGLQSMPISCNYTGPTSDSPITNVAAAVTGVGSSVYFFAKTIDGRIMYETAQLGQGGLCWVEVEGNGRTDAAPAAAAVGTHVFVAVKGLDGRVYINQSDLGRPFGQWFPSDIVTDAPPAVAGVGNSVYFFAKTRDGRVMYTRAQLGQAGIPWREVEGAGRTDAAPAAAAVGTHIFVVIKGRDSQVYVNQADLNQPFGQWFPSGTTTDVAPGVAGVGDTVYFFAKGSDGRILYNRAKLGQGGVGWREIEGNGRTDTAPAAGAVGDHVFVAIRRADGRLAINQGDKGQPFGQWF
jgi:hypothetical protein